MLKRLIKNLAYRLISGQAHPARYVVVSSREVDHDRLFDGPMFLAKDTTGVFVDEWLFQTGMIFLSTTRSRRNVNRCDFLTKV